MVCRGRGQAGLGAGRFEQQQNVSWSLMGANLKELQADRLMQTGCVSLTWRAARRDFGVQK